MSSFHRTDASRLETGEGRGVVGGVGRPGRRAGPRLIFAVLMVVAAVTVSLVLLLVGGSTSSSNGPATARQHYGGLPSWLPKAKVQVHRVLQAGAGHTAVSVEGEAVAVTMPDGAKAQVTAVGPEVPEEGRFPVPAVTPTTFLVTFAASSKPIPLRQRDFELFDEHGNIHRPKLTALHGGPAPAATTPGHSTTVKLHDILPTGDGAVAWAPAGGKPIAAWDFTVEID